MAAYKCKMCGGDLIIEAGSSVCECEYCGSKQTVPTADNEKKMTMFTRAGRLLRACEFDKASGVFESIVADFPDEAEAYWGLVLCSYGIEYVDDPATGKKVPTCHRSSFDSVMDDENFDLACENADGVARRLYREEAKAIEGLRKGIIEVSGKEAPYDVFISYKETDENGERTEDSVIAQNIYDALTDKGYRVFFSRITLEDRLGTEYEPYIFAALHSAKLMLVVGTDYEHMNAVWVKNEWSRFLKLMGTDRSKTLITCFKGIDAYDMPKEFNKLTAQDMGKVGAMQDLLRGVGKILHKEECVVVQQVVGGASVSNLLDRMFLYLEDGKWQDANTYAEKVLDMDFRNGEAYLGKLMAALHIQRRADIPNYAEPIESNENYAKALRFGSPALVSELEAANIHTITRNKNKIYNDAQTMMGAAKTEGDYKKAATYFGEIPNWKDADAKAAECLELAELARKDKLYDDACAAMAKNTISDYCAAIERLKTISAHKDSAAKIKQCEKKIAVLEVKVKKTKKVAAIAAVIVVIAAFLIVKVVIPGLKYNNALELKKSGQTLEAAVLFGEAGGFKDAREQAVALWRELPEYVSAGGYYTVALKNDGTVVAVGNDDERQCDVSGWRDVVTISAGIYHTVGVKRDGTVVAMGLDFCRGDITGQCLYARDWKNIVSMSAGLCHTVGLKSDGTVVATGDNEYGQCDVRGWRDIVAISACWDNTVGLKSDGTVVATGDNEYGQCDVSGWRDIVAISAGAGHTVGLRSDGTVVAVGENEDGQCDISGWRDIVAISAGAGHTVGLRSDGTVVAVGENEDGQCDVSGWRDVVAISAGYYHTVALKSDGTVVAVGENEDGQCDVSGWSIFAD